MTTTHETPTRNGAFIDVDGVGTYYEVTGTGEPLLLLHGGLCPAESWDPQTAALAERYRVYVPERFGHGRTPDVDGPITYESMAQHTIRFMEELGIDSAHLCGWSDGAVVALLVSLRRPKLVRKLVLLSQFVTLDGAPPAYLPFITALTPETAPAFLFDMYAALSPDGPEHFAVVFDKLRAAWTDETGIELSDLAHVMSPTLIVDGDDGCMTLEHAAAVHAALPDSQLAIVPGTSHALAMEKPHVVNQLLLDFFAEEQVTRMLSLEGEGT